MSKYNDLKKELRQVKNDESAAVKQVKDKVKAFVASQTFTGKELLDMVAAIKDGHHGTGGEDKPRIDYVIERILAYREES